MGNIKQSFLAGLFSIITIGILAGLTYKTELGIFLLASFGSSMVLLYGYPESPFAQPKNVFFGHLITALVGVIFVHFIPLPIYINIAAAVGIGVFLILHDLNLALNFSDKIALLKEGRLVEFGQPMRIFNDKTLSEIYDTPISVDLNSKRVNYY